MDYLLEETVPAAELKKFESRYMSELDAEGKVAAGTQFEYAWCLVRSKYPADIRKGIALLEDLFQVRYNDGNDPTQSLGGFPLVPSPTPTHTTTPTMVGYGVKCSSSAGGGHHIPTFATLGPGKLLSLVHTC